ncbi:hypothetical protein EV177_004215 [Coemansia sp. RSA 1804]|nr:hypothetical protein EV177_004215 [Coemansia sp. RSA 1804]
MKSTPIVSRTKSTGVLQNTATDSRDVASERRKKSISEINKYVEDSIATVADLVKPSVQRRRVLAEKAINSAIAEIEGHLGTAKKRSTSTVLKRTFANTDPEFDQKRAVDSILALCRFGKQGSKSSSANGSLEKDLYLPFADFVMLAAQHTLSAIKESKCSDASLILPYWASDFTPSNSDDDTKIDGALVVCSAQENVKGQPDPDYRNIFAIVEFKRNSTSRMDSFGQLIDYTRNLYANQLNRRFAWALSVCGTNVYACLFHHDGVRASTAMDLATTAGRKGFVSLLVNWSLCETPKLGYDPSVRIDPATRNGEIDCFTDADEEGGKQKHTYSVKDVISISTSVFGRHTQCFLASPKNVNDRHVVIKDSWPLVVGRDGENLEKFNEVEHLKLIDEKLRSNYKGVLYSKIVMAGTVRIKHGPKEIPDETFAIFADDSAKEYGCRRSHQRIVLDTYGEHLKTLKNENELIMVLADAMLCHNTILEKCKLLHRDISDNNILVVRNSHNESSAKTKDLQNSLAKDPSSCRPVRGLLIDFDYAALVEPDSGCSGRDHRSGTLPFMSIHNLSGESGRRTALDDWESLLYLACWLGTFGITRKDRRKAVVHENAPIRKWRSWNMSIAADSKRTSMDSKRSFLAHIVKHINGKYPLLRDFVIEIHKKLFLYKKDCSGSLVIFDDPLVQRDQHKSKIVKALMRIPLLFVVLTK